VGGGPSSAVGSLRLEEVKDVAGELLEIDLLVVVDL
jgi:hypothetical protein